MSDQYADEYAGFEKLVQNIERETGLCFPEVHHETIIKAARTHCAKLGLGPSAYSQILDSDSEEKARFLDDIMIGETYFFRDEKQFTALNSWVLPQLFTTRQRIAVWSATCASGEEAISLLAMLDSARERVGSSSVCTLIASDINRQALRSFRSGKFPLSSFRSDGRSWHLLLDPHGVSDGSAWTCNPDFLARIDIRHLNLLSGSLPAEQFDLVLFRNTLVYMKQDQKQQVLQRVIATIRPGGFLFLASPEVPSVRHAALNVVEREGVFFFQRTAEADRQADSSRQSSSSIRTFDVTARSSAIDKAYRQTQRTIGHRSASSLGLREVRLALELLAGCPSDPSSEVSGSVRELADLVSNIATLLADNRFPSAESKIETLEKVSGETFLSHHLRGLLFKHKGMLPEAVAAWERARLYDNEFWPACFNLALYYADSDIDRTKLLLQECSKHLNESQAADHYSVLLDGFDTAYYRHMTTRLMERAKAGRNSRGGNKWQ